MAVETMKNGGMMISGKEDTARFRLVALKSALRFEIKCPGMKMSRGPSAYSIIKREFGLKGNKQKVFDQFCEMHGLV